MSELEKENIMIQLEIAAEKADYMAKSLIDNYQLDSGAINNQMEALVFAGNRGKIGMEVEIVCDYIDIIQKSLEALREIVME